MVLSSDTNRIVSWLCTSYTCVVVEGEPKRKGGGVKSKPQREKIEYFERKGISNNISRRKQTQPGTQNRNPYLNDQVRVDGGRRKLVSARQLVLVHPDRPGRREGSGRREVHVRHNARVTHVVQVHPAARPGQTHNIGELKDTALKKGAQRRAFRYDSKKKKKKKKNSHESKEGGGNCVAYTKLT